MDDQEKLAQQKINAIMTFVVVSSTGEVDNDSSYSNFAEALSKYADRYNKLVDEVRPSVQAVLNQEPTQFKGMDDVKYAVRRNLEDKDLQVTSDELNGLLHSLVKSKFLISRRGRSGGVQQFDNAVAIIARTHAKDQEITDELIAKTRAHLLNDENVSG